MGADEDGTLERLKALRRELLDPQIAEHRGRISGSSPGTKTTGHGLLVEFASVVVAVRWPWRCSAKRQRWGPRVVKAMETRI
jgi:adenylate cyclase